MDKIDKRVWAALLFVQVAFGGLHVVAKVVLTHLHPLALASIRVLCATPILFALAWWLEGKLPRLRDLPHLALLGMLGVFFNQMLFLIGLQYTTATNAGIIMPSIPIFTVMLAALFGVERINRRQFAGILLAVGGAVFMLNPLGFSLANDKVFGNILMLINTLCYAGFLVAQRPLLRRLPPLTVIAWAFLFGSIGMLIAGHRHLLAVDFAAVPSSAWLGMVYIVLIPTVISYGLNAWSLSRSSPSLVAVFTTLQPVTATVLAAIFLHEQARWYEAMGFFFIVTGLFVVSRGRLRR